MATTSYIKLARLQAARGGGTPPPQAVLDRIAERTLTGGWKKSQGTCPGCTLLLPVAGTCCD